VKVVVFGATGVVGRAAVEHFATVADDVIGVSRRPVDVAGVTHIGLDLTDEAVHAKSSASPAFAGTTHVVYAALQESPDLVSGWRDPELMDRNLRMFNRALDPLLTAHGGSVEHVSLLQGAKAYGLHVGKSPIPAKERSPRDAHDNFYFLHEDALLELAARHGFGWTILRPQVVYGESFASPMNLLPAIGVYATLERERGHALSFPGGGRGVHEAVDARLLARVLTWAATTPSARNEIFNVTNGDVFDWHDVWPAIAEAFDMAVGDPEQQQLAETMPARAEEWAAAVDRYDLRAPREMADFVGGSWQYADMLLAGTDRRALPALLSTVKLRQAGFAECIDTEDMFREWFEIFRERRLLP
jgi:nucleoside-diphosphate-sugar epimerase